MNKKQSLVVYVLILVIIHVLVFLVGGLDLLSLDTNTPVSYAGLILGMEVILLPVAGIIFILVYGINSIIRRFIKNNFILNARSS